MFDVKVTGSFTYNGKKYSNETCTIENVTVKGGGTTEVAAISMGTILSSASINSIRS